MQLEPPLAQLVGQARLDLAQRLGMTPDSFALKKAEAAEWPDASLGCPQPGMMYAQVITPGFVIVLEGEGREYEYHASRSHVVLCN